LREFPCLDDGIPGVAFSPDGRTLAAASSGYLLNPETGEEGRQVAKESHLERCVAFSLDGRLVAFGGYDGVVRLCEVATGAEVYQFHGHQGPIRAVAFFPDGKTLASAGDDTTVLLWDVTLGHGHPRGQFDVAERRELAAAQDALGGSDASRAYRAVWTLAGAGQRAVAVLEGPLRRAAMAEWQVPRLLADLDSDDFATRERATEHLQKLRAEAEAALRNALKRRPNPEARRRVESVLASEDIHRWPAAALQQIRAVQALDYNPTPEAHQLLEALPASNPDTLLTQEVKAALKRLVRRHAQVP
jgi:hypothetical protein